MRELERLDAPTPADLDALVALRDESFAAMGVAAGPQATPSAADVVGSLVCVAVDDCDFMRHKYTETFQKLGATNSACVGATAEEQLAFVDLALGLLDPSSLAPTPNGREADVALLDQRIDLKYEPHLLGTDLAVELRTRGFTGVVAIVSGKDEDGLQRLRATPGVDLVVGKGALHGGGLVEQLREALAAKRQSDAGGGGGHGGGDGGPGGGHGAPDAHDGGHGGSHGSGGNEGGGGGAGADTV